MPAVSIVVPSYNHSRFIPQCVQSVQNQTFTDWELIVVDDGSTDASVSVWHSFADPRISVLVNKSNIGTYATQNRGIELAKSDLIAILNSDDFWAPEKLERQVALLSKHPETTLCYTFGWPAREDGRPDDSDERQAGLPTDEIQELFPHLLASNSVFASSVMFRKEWAVFDPNLPFSGDWKALFQSSFEGPVACAKERLSFWRVHGSSTHQIRKPVALEHIGLHEAILRKQETWLAGRFERSLVKQKLGESALHLCALYVLFGDMARARRAGWRAVRFDPSQRTAWKRLLGSFLPSAKAKARLWPNVTDSFAQTELGAVRQPELL